MHYSIVISTGKSLSEALIFGSTNRQYDKRLFIDLPVQYMKTTSLEHKENMLCSKIVLNVKTKTKNNLCAQHVLPCSELVVFMYWTGKSMNNLFFILWVSWSKNKCFWQRFTCIGYIMIFFIKLRWPGEKFTTASVDFWPALHSTKVRWSFRQECNWNIRNFSKVKKKEKKKISGISKIRT
jgi:hypothetical protein